MNHTPGPWAVHHHESTDTYTIHVAGRSWESWAVAHVGDCTQDQENARLIAAAPDLLAALQGLLADPYLSDPINADRMAPARAAIEKATQ